MENGVIHWIRSIDRLAQSSWSIYWLASFPNIIIVVYFCTKVVPYSIWNYEAKIWLDGWAYGCSRVTGFNWIQRFIVWDTYKWEFTCFERQPLSIHLLLFRKSKICSKVFPGISVAECDHQSSVFLKDLQKSFRHYELITPEVYHNDKLIETASPLVGKCRYFFRCFGI